MKVLILGGSGMIGHQLLIRLFKNFEVMTTLRFSEDKYKEFKIFNKKNSFFNVNVLEDLNLKKTIINFNPEIIINAVGITKQKIFSNKLVNRINSNFPKTLLKICIKENIKLIHLSTDCVFSGDKGFYNETDIPDPNEPYGKSKYRGEIKDDSNIIILRKSTIGPELRDKHGLFEWFISKKGDIEGYKNAKFTGITSIELANIIEKIILHHKELYGLWHVAGPTIDKYSLLMKIKSLLQRKDVNILLNESFKCDRTLDGRKFSSLTNYQPPLWDEMLSDMIREYNNV